MNFCLGDNVGILLEHAKKFQMQEITRRCETFLLDSQSLDNLCANLIVAQTYNMPTLQKRCVERLKYKSIHDWQLDSLLDTLNDENKLILLKQRIKLLECKGEATSRKANVTQGGMERLVDIFDSMCGIMASGKERGKRLENRILDKCNEAIKLIRDINLSLGRPPRK